MFADQFGINWMLNCETLHNNVNHVQRDRALIYFLGASSRREHLRITLDDPYPHPKLC